ncbi:hypothetical protein QQ045_004363 [Rhodiola kirilowii]
MASATEGIDPFPANPISELVDLSAEFDSLPPLDHLFFSHNSDSAPAAFSTDLGIGEDDYELDLDFSFDDLYMDEDAGEIMLADHKGQITELPVDRGSPLDSKDSNSVAISEDRKEIRVIDALNFASDGKETCNDDREHAFGIDQLKKSGDLSSDSSRVNVSSSPEAGSIGNNKISKQQISVDHWSRKIGDFSSEISRPASSQGSGNAGSGSEAMEFHSHNFDRDISSKLPDCKIKVEEEGGKYIPKRKKESEDVITESRIRKFRKSSANMEADGSGGPEDDRRKARLIRNRESAQLSRQRKKHYVEELEDKVRAMHATITDLNGKISYLMAENANLRQQLGGGVMCPPPPGVYTHHPMAPVGYPWMPCPPYAMNGSQTPVVPIPRLKPQQPLPAPKSKKSDSKKSDSKKTEVKTKKVASISLLGLLVFLFLFGAVVPMVNLKYRGMGNQVHNGHQDWILTVNSDGNRSGKGMGSDFKTKFDYDDKERRFRGSYVKEKKEATAGRGESSKEGNFSLPLVASLYVPRNDKLVKIDGNLIIHSVLASEKAMKSQKTSATMKSKTTGLAVPKNVAPAWAYSEAGKNRNRQPHLFKNQNERRRALADSSKASSDDPQQWFREGLAGPMLSSGLCTEVFQFDMSPGAVIPASSAMNTSSNHQSNSTQLTKRIKRRSLRGLPDHLHNMTGEHIESNYTKESLHDNKSASPMIVSVLVDPKDSEADGIMGWKSVPRIFVVVLQERVKYVTYSCVLPIKKGSNPHLVR